MVDDSDPNHNTHKCVTADSISLMGSGAEVLQLSLQGIVKILVVHKNAE